MSARNGAPTVLVVQNSQMAHHPRHHYRLAAALARAGADVRMLSQPDPGNGHIDAVPVDALPVRRSRLGRIASGPLTMARAVLRRPDAIYVVTLELLPWAVLARALGRSAVLYDSNEEYHDDMLQKEWLPAWSRRAASMMIARVEPWLAGRLDGVTTAVPVTQERFRARGTDSVLVRNFPPSPLPVAAGDVTRRPATDVLLGGTVQADLLPVLADTVQHLERLRPGTTWRIVLRDCRPAEQAALAALLDDRAAGDHVEVRVNRPFPEMAEHMASARVGFIFFKGVALPQRMFEYMAAGLPFVAADLPWVGDILRDSDVGVLARPDPAAYAEALAALLDDPPLQARMANAGRRAAAEQYSFENEARRLVDLYEVVLARSISPRA
jgi:hypothetical protein